MTILSNAKFKLEFNGRGAVTALLMKEDPAAMNWVVDPEYLAEAGYEDTLDKLFGEWTAVVDGQTLNSAELTPEITRESDSRMRVRFMAEKLEINLTYALEEECIRWIVECKNRADRSVRIEGLHIWFALAYVMFRDENVLRNMRQSCAVFAHLGGDFAKFAAIRRSDEAPHLAVYGVKGRTAAFGSFCRYENRFLEQVSPSLDGVLFHRLSLVEDGGSMPESAAADWIYRERYHPVVLEAGQNMSWEYAFASCEGREDFYRQAMAYGHPRWEYTPVLVRGGMFEAELELPAGERVREIRVVSAVPAAAGSFRRREEAVTDRLAAGVDEAVTERLAAGVEETVTERFAADGRQGEVLHLALRREEAGEHKLELTLDDGRKDVLVWNVLEPVDRILEKRAEWLCRNNYDPAGTAGRPHAFLPLSNQGESLGKLAFLLMKNSLAAPVPEQVAMAEASAVLDMKHHWFEGGDFSRPRVLYGTFYRIFDLDYIAHVFYLLSRMDAALLKLHPPQTYLRWAAEVLCVRLDPDCHEGQREKNETGLNGVFIMYVLDLLADLAACGLTGELNRLQALWEAFGSRLKRNASQFAGAVTEHFYDNAGFGPTCETLLRVGLTGEGEKYARLILANIGFSNDYRGQNPDRWWEALSYMIHSLWGGLVAASARTAYEHLGDPQYLEAAYRASMAVFNCYDWNVVSTPRRLQPGEAASTYSVAAPNLNMPSLSRNRFGQSVFRGASDPLFARLFANAAGDDWDMGEELVAYLLGFGTTAYLYRDEQGRLRCANGCLTRDGDGWIITSYAAYPRQIVMREEGLVLRAQPGEALRQARYRDGKLAPLL
ncbi:MAG: hypothetical protein E7L01_11745 [Paenibacillus macerans]|uniref:hypothetical protein n=1 Tax=Paenibacillus TaxID=44249 RepID=UPI002907B9E6|nr:hypothetical protein [Paenibacillus macerans]MDU7473998.1 hypothetical protein [Paenibacillus macerans]